MPKVSADIARARERQAWALRVEGATHEEIAAQLGVTRQAVAKMLARSGKVAHAQLVEDVTAFKAVQLQRLERVHREAMAGWERSKEAKKKSRKKTTTVPILKTGAEAPAPTIAREEDLKEAITSAGNPSYLQTAMAAIAEENKLLGLHAPKKIDVLDQRRPLAQLSDEELAARAKEADALLKAEGRG